MNAAFLSYATAQQHARRSTDTWTYPRGKAPRRPRGRVWAGFRARLATPTLRIATS